MRPPANRAWPKLLVGLCLVAVVVGAVPLGRLPLTARVAGPGVASAGELEDAQQELERIQRLIEQKQAEFDRVSAQERSVIKDINRIQRELDGLESDLRSLQRQLNEAEAAIASTEVDISEAQVRLDERTDLMLTRVRALSEVGYVSYLEVILGARSFADFLGRFELLRQVLSSDVALFREVKEEKRQLEAKKAYLEEQRAEIANLRTQTSARKAAVEEKQQAKAQLLAKLRDDKKAIAEAEDELERTSEKLKDYILQLQLAAQQSGALPQFAWPASGPITSGFGPRFHPILKAWKNHTGLDIAVPYGTRVSASASGTVIFAGWAGGYGKTVMIAHPGNSVTLYAHMSVISVKDGQVVVKGAKVGEVGSTGYSTGPHLHFEIRINGDPVNPLPLLPKR